MDIAFFGIMLLQVDFPIHLNCIDVQGQTETSIVVLHEATIDDYWNIGEDKSLSEPWIGVSCSTQIHQTDTCGLKADKRRNRLLQDLERIGRKIVNISKCSQREAINIYSGR